MIFEHVVALTVIFNIKIKIALERPHLTITQHKSYEFSETNAVSWAYLRCPKNPPTHFENFPRNSHPNFEIFKETDLNYSAVEFFVSWNP